MRKAIVESLTTALKLHDFVLAMWQGGSAAHGHTDEWSDLDLQVIVQDAWVEQTLVLIEQTLTTIAPIRFQHRVPEPTWHGHAQCFYGLEATNPFLFLDLVILQQSSPNHFLDRERNGTVIVSFDKMALLVQHPLNWDEHLAKMRQSFNQLQETFELRQRLVQKEIHRKHWVEAVMGYHKWTLQPLIELLGMLYRPYRYDFNAKYFSRDFPPEVKARVEPLLCVTELADLKHKQRLAEDLFVEVLPQVGLALRSPQSSIPVDPG
ncbi:nucleotidyltransferase domain-containing protein [Oculatella sp. LEGE 06141]|uniref:nucleotidyltransferase domain-containing protein n=1 Tax=Oculatella sp. LEGE 06141 TaxID=1828648 RepID=UPI00187EC818|nr:nucleotidyltransferase domain-containing protein [Oculatella sp. LEGE 06141]MBE9177128.1 nucleotidyltransferase domain-containing protein [Oculatella sp. LEGE 06141]